MLIKKLRLLVLFFIIYKILIFVLKENSESYALVEWMDKGKNGQIEYTPLPIRVLKNSSLQPLEEVDIVEDGTYAVYSNKPYKCIEV